MGAREAPAAALATVSDKQLTNGCVGPAVCGPAGASEQQPVSLTAKPELYSALTAAVAAIVQQAGLTQIQPSAGCSRGISMQYHAEGKESKLEGQRAQPEGQEAHLEGQRQESPRQQSRGDGQQRSPAGQQQISVVLAHSNTGQEQEPKAQHAQRDIAQVQEAEQANEHSMTGNASVSARTDRSGQLQAWQGQIQQALEVLQATLQSSGSNEVASVVAQPR